MADAITRSRLNRIGWMRFWICVVAGAAFGLALQWWFGPPVALARAWLELSLAAQKSAAPFLNPWVSVALTYISGPILGFGLGSVIAKSPPGRWFLQRVIPDPPSFVRTDLSAEREAAMNLMERKHAPDMLGRGEESAALLSFAREPGTPFRWRAVIGPTGIGKTRLAIEWLAALRADGWDIGLIDPPNHPIAENWRPRKRTAFIIDEAERSWGGDRLGELLGALANAARPRAPIRVLVLDQTEPSRSLTSNGAVRDEIMAGRDDALLLGGIDSDALADLWHACGRLNPSKAHLAQETGGRPRALLTLAEAADTDNYAQALGIWASRLFPALDDNAKETASAKPLLETLALAVLAGPLPASVATGLVGGGYDKEALRRFFPSGDLDATLPAFEPEDLGQEILLRTLAILNAPERKALTDAVLRAGQDAVRRVERVLGDLWSGRPEAADALRVFHGRPLSGGATSERATCAIAAGFRCAML